MPIYEYACDKCSHEFEVEQRITDDPVKSCPKCKGRKVRRLISRTSFVLKGGGWYSDLYSSQKPGGGDSGGDSDGGGKGGASESKSESSKSESSKSGGKGAGDSGAKGGKSEGGPSRKKKGAKAAA